MLNWRLVVGHGHGTKCEELVPSLAMDTLLRQCMLYMLSSFLLLIIIINANRYCMVDACNSSCVQHS